MQLSFSYRQHRQHPSESVQGLSSRAVRRRTCSKERAGPHRLVSLALRAPIPAIGLTLVLAVALSLALSPGLALAQASIRLDDTLPGVPAGDLLGPNYQIDETQGVTVGENQFHSFERFGLQTGETATFGGPATTQRFISRVTGGEVSRIEGLIRTTVEDADFYLLNPSGVVVTEGGAIDVRGDVTFSTADEITLGEDAGLFSAISPLSSVLSSAPVSAFGFLSNSPAPIQILNTQLTSRFDDTSQLLGHDLALIGGDLEIRGTRTPGEFTYLYSRGGQITLVSLGGPGTVEVAPGSGPGDPSEINVDPTALRGDIFIGDRAIAISGGPPPDVEFCIVSEGCQFANGSGDIQVFGDSLLLDSGELRAITVTNRDAGSVNVDLTGDLVLRGSDPTSPSFITALSGLEIGGEDGGFITFTQFFPLAEGVLRVETETNFSNEVSRVTFLGSGDAGDISIRAANVSLEGLSEISSAASFGGDAGAIQIDAPNGTIVIDATNRSGEFGSIITNSRDDSGDNMAGNGGAITITAAELRLQNDARILSEVRDGEGQGGTITIDVARLRLIDDGRIDSSTRGDGDGGSILISATEDALLSGQVDPTTFSGISTLSQPEANGNAGEIRVTTPSLELNDGARITTTALGEGDAGTIDLRTGTLALSESAITAEADLGQGGDIYVNAGPVLVGPNGELSVTPVEGVSPGNLIFLTRSEISTSVSTGGGGGGDIALAATSIIALNSQILAQADGGDGGNIRTESSSLILDDPDDINADSALSENGIIDSTSPAVVIRADRPDLPARIRDATDFLRDACAARSGGAIASLVLQTHSGLAPSPAGPLAVATPVPSRLATITPIAGSQEHAAPVASASAPLLVRVTCPG